MTNRCGNADLDPSQTCPHRRGKGLGVKNFQNKLLQVYTYLHFNPPPRGKMKNWKMGKMKENKKKKGGKRKKEQREKRRKKGKRSEEGEN